MNLLWVISHPDDVSDTELRSFDVAFAAGPVWAAGAAARAGVPVRTLLQATDPAVFHPGSRSDTTEDAVIAPWWSLALIPLGTVLVVAAATSLPARLATRIRTADALRYE